MPTFMAFKDGQKVDQLVGAHPVDLQVRHPFSLPFYFLLICISSV